MAPSVAQKEKLEFRPQPQQELFLSSDADIAVFGGAAGGGKTWSLLLEPLRYKDNPRFYPVIFRRTHTRITQSGGMWDESMQIYSHFATPRSDLLQWTFPSGARIKFAHLQHEDDRFDYKGAQIPLMGFDQLEEFVESQFWYLLSRNRSTCGVIPYIRATCNPVPEDDATGGWLNKLISWYWNPDTGIPIPERSGKIRWFIRDDDRLVWSDSREELIAEYPFHQPLSFTFIFSTLADNPALEKADPTYRAKMMALPKVERERLLGGNWLIRESAGQVFNRAWLKTQKASPLTGRVVRYWDKAGSTGETATAASAGVRMRWAEDKRFYIEDVTEGKWSARQREEVIQQVAKSDGPDVDIWVEQEPGSGGKESAESTILNLPGFYVRADRVTGAKVARARPMSAQAEAGNVILIEGEWNESFLKQAHRFEEDANMIDAADAAVGAFNQLVTEPPPNPPEPYGGMSYKNR